MCCATPTKVPNKRGARAPPRRAPAPSPPPPPPPTPQPAHGLGRPHRPHRPHGLCAYFVGPDQHVNAVPRAGSLRPTYADHMGCAAPADPAAHATCADAMACLWWAGPPAETPARRRPLAPTAPPSQLAPTLARRPAPTPRPASALLQERTPAGRIDSALVACTDCRLRRHHDLRRMVRRRRRTTSRWRASDGRRARGGLAKR